MWIRDTPSACVTLAFTYPHVLAILTSNSFLSMMITYSHVPDEARMNDQEASYLVSIDLIFVFIKRKKKLFPIPQSYQKCFWIHEIDLSFKNDFHNCKFGPYFDPSIFITSFGQRMMISSTTLCLKTNLLKFHQG